MHQEIDWRSHQACGPLLQGQGNSEAAQASYAKYAIFPSVANLHTEVQFPARFRALCDEEQIAIQVVVRIPNLDRQGWIGFKGTEEAKERSANANAVKSVQAAAKKRAQSEQWITKLNSYHFESDAALMLSHLVYRLTLMMTSLRSKRTAGKARGGRISKSIRNRRATQPPPIFNATLWAAASWLFPRCSLAPYQFRDDALRSRLEKQPTDLRRCHHYRRDGNTSPGQNFMKSSAAEPVRSLGSLLSEDRSNANPGQELLILEGRPCAPSLMPEQGHGQASHRSWVTSTHCCIEGHAKIVTPHQ
ncbi:MAG: hypothetical protein JO334_06685 [Verrucomicrobia bacterium]|nr:hypothetical protein [Verrucomicrobiota bacterium]